MHYSHYKEKHYTIYKILKYFVITVCRRPSNVIGSTFKYEMEQNKMIYYYECDEGLTLVCDNTLQCKSNRAWTPPMFVCTGMFYFINHGYI